MRGGGARFWLRRIVLTRVIGGLLMAIGALAMLSILPGWVLLALGSAALVGLGWAVFSLDR